MVVLKNRIQACPIIALIYGRPIYNNLDHTTFQDGPVLDFGSVPEN
jgi:hypothetical protein